MKQTGQILKEAREAQKLTVNEVAMATKINPRMIRALEEGDLEALPAKTFLRGFVRSYAGQLKLDVDQVLDTFLEEMGTTLPEHTEHPSESAPTASSRLPVIQDRGIIQKVLAATAIIFLILLIIGVKKVVEKYEKEGQVERPTDIQGLNREETAPVPEPTEEGTNEANLNPNAPEKTASNPELEPNESESTKLEKINQEEVEKQALEKATAEKAKQEEVEKQAAATAAEQKTATEVEAQKPEAPPTAPVAAAEKEEAKKPVETAGGDSALATQEIILEALDNVVVEFRVNKGQLQKVTLQPDQIHTIKAKGSVAIDLSDGGAVNIIHNGQERGVPGDLGVPKKVKIP